VHRGHRAVSWAPGHTLSPLLPPTWVTIMTWGEWLATRVAPWGCILGFFSVQHLLVEDVPTLGRGPRRHSAIE
jgi:hypothetical protein